MTGPIADLVFYLIIYFVVCPVIVGMIVAVYYEVRYRHGITWQREQERRQHYFGIKE